MDEDIILEQSFQLIIHDFGLPTNEDEVLKNKTFKWLLDILIRHINYLMDNDFNALLNALYRIDLEEQKVKTILAETEPNKLAYELAQLIIEREKQKAISRLMYR